MTANLKHTAYIEQNKGNFYEIRAAYRLALIHSACSSN